MSCLMLARGDGMRPTRDKRIPAGRNTLHRQLMGSNFKRRDRQLVYTVFFRETAPLPQSVISLTVDNVGWCICFFLTFFARADAGQP